jgi:hypothetical protein
MEDALAQINADHSHFHMGSSVNRLLHDLPLPSEDQAADHPINTGQATCSKRCAMPFSAT